MAGKSEFWNTSNKDYGRFYNGTKSVDSASVYRDKCDRLSIELKECRRKLDELERRLPVPQVSSRPIKQMLRYQDPIPSRTFGLMRPDHQDRQRPDVTCEACEDSIRAAEEFPEFYIRPETEFMEGDFIQPYRYRMLAPKHYNMYWRPPDPVRIRRPPEEMDPHPVDPASVKYSHYKFYGYGGYGAKTSWGHNYPSAHDIEHSRRIHRLPPF